MTSQQTTFVPAKTNHVLHLILTLITCGMWGLVWVIVALYNANRTVPVVSVQTVPYQEGWVPNSIERGQWPAHQEFVERKEGT